MNNLPEALSQEILAIFNAKRHFIIADSPTGAIMLNAMYAAAKHALTTSQPQQTGASEKIAPVQGYSAGIPWSMHLRAYDAYCKLYGKQEALIDLEGRHCRGGFGTGELDGFIPGWREELSEINKLKKELEELRALYAGTAPVSQPQTDEGLVERMEMALSKGNVWRDAERIDIVKAATACADLATAHMQPLVEALERISRITCNVATTVDAIEIADDALNSHKENQK